MIKLGAHVSTAGGFEKALTHLSNIGGNVLQIFLHHLGAGTLPKTDPLQTSRFKEAKEKCISVMFFSCLLSHQSRRWRKNRTHVKIIPHRRIKSRINSRGERKYRTPWFFQR